MRTSRALLLLPFLFACSGEETPLPTPDAGIVRDGGVPDGGPPVDPDGCQPLTLDRRDFQFNLFGQLTGLRFTVGEGVGGERPDPLLVELYDSTTEGLPALRSGTFDLAGDGNDNLATCQHCVWLKVDEAEDGTSDGIYYAERGEIALTTVEDPLESVFAGSTGRVVLRRATVTDEGRSVFVPGGDCVSFERIEFDTSPTPGAACLSAEHCGNPLLEVCDPVDNLCVEPQCGEFAGCPESRPVCVTQYRDVFQGACYQECDPTADTCDDGQRCVQFGVDPAYGLCRHVGGAEPNAACEVTDNGTGCAGAAVCSSVTNTCAPTCNFFDATTGCPDPTLCSLFGVCEPASASSPAVLGEPCAEGDELATACAPTGDALRGICFAYPPEAPICEKACLGDRGCSAGEFCGVRFTSGLGVCLPVPICGDGALGEIDEVCDDGNTTSGDGCSGDCSVVEYEVICAALPALPFGVDIEGDTTSAWDGFQSSCQAGRARAGLYAVDLPGPGRLTLQVTSKTDHSLALLGSCLDAGSELSCAEQARAQETESITYQVTSTGAVSLTAMVSAFTVLEEGAYTVRADFVAEQCGDSIVAGREACDDGNTNDGDGCRGDCRALEYDVYCAAASTLTMGTVEGDTTGRPHLFTTSCASDFGTGSGVDDLYRFVAPSDGTLHLFLESSELLIVGVLDGCGEPTEVTELACNASFTLGDVDVPMIAGQSVTVIVEGFLADSRGPYRLETSFTPN